MNVRFKQVGALFTVAACAGCGNGGATAPAPATASAVPAQGNAKKVAVRISFATAGDTASSRVRSSAKRQYVSPATLGAIVVATSTTSANRASHDLTAGFDLTAANQNCAFDQTANAFDCTFDLTLVPDTYTLTLTTYDAPESTLPANPGTALSVDTETETVGTGDNSFVLDPEAYVAGFSYNSFTSPAPHLGAIGGTNSYLSLTVHALDRHFYLIDQYPAGKASFVNGIFKPVIVETGDTTNCTASTVCSSLENDNGTTYPAYATTVTPATIALPVNDDESLVFSYLGGGGPGTGVKTWTTGDAPSGTAPYSADYSIPDPSNGTVVPYTVPHGYIDPLFGYATDGAGHPFTTSASSNTTFYVWAAQAHVPDPEPANGAGYSAVFDSTKIDRCFDTNGTTVATIGTATYYPGYGAVFAVAVTPSQLQTTCTIDVLDGANDTYSTPITITAAAAASR